MTLDEIAKLAGVSKTTASYVINGKAKKYRISEKTQLKVMAVVHQYNYSPDHAASSLRAGSSKSFGLIIPDLENSSYAKLAKLLESNSRKAGYQILMGCSDDAPEIEKNLVSTLLSRRIDALFVASSLADGSEYYLNVQQQGTPVIAIDRALDDEYFGCVISEDFDGAYELTASLISQNVKTIGLIGALPHLNISQQRYAGFNALAKKKGIECISCHGENFNHESGKAMLMDWIEKDCVPDAIIVTSYILLEGMLDVLIERPELVERVKFGTFGDNRLLDFLPMKINSLHQQFELIADSALTLGLNASAKRYQAGIELIARKLVLRN